MDAGLAALIGAGLGLLGGVGTSALNAFSTAKRERSAAIAGARRDAYIEVLELCETLQKWAHETYPMMQSADAPPPVYPEASTRIRVAALVKLYGSPEVRQQFSKFLAWLGEFQMAAETITFVRSRASEGNTSEGLGDQEVEAWRQLPTFRAELQEKVDSLARAMRRDVLGEPI